MPNMETTGNLPPRHTPSKTFKPVKTGDVGASTQGQPDKKSNENLEAENQKLKAVIPRLKLRFEKERDNYERFNMYLADQGALTETIIEHQHRLDQLDKTNEKIKALEKHLRSEHGRITKHIGKLHDDVCNLEQVAQSLNTELSETDKSDGADEADSLKRDGHGKRKNEAGCGGRTLTSYQGGHHSHTLAVRGCRSPIVLPKVHVTPDMGLIAPPLSYWEPHSRRRLSDARRRTALHVNKLA
jgi:hypothetical protein